MTEVNIKRSEKGYLLLTINRVEKRNAINYEVMDGLQKAIELVKQDKELKALVITGAGERAFCSGGDLSVFHGLKTEEEAYGMLSKMANILYELCTLTKPTVALINGIAIGGGCELLTACDFRIANNNAKLGFVQGNLAITTGWGGASIAYEKWPTHTALKLFMGSNVMEAPKWFDLGLVDQLYEQNGIEECEKFLAPFLEKETGVLEAYKQALISKWETNQLVRRVEEEVRRCSILWEAEAHHEAVNRFMNK